MQQEIRAEEKQAAKKPYQAPELVNHGSVEELTESIRHFDQGGSCLPTPE